ncbi:unnamed protein product [Protopolystoma xenopodis]|uniref:Uncharacterized protein n=1 Tax=Protopolystoma xenopodis TaxID=117903 RepID=A0A3S5A761_9PLAT|nr:unnamed protein product [Protopolystoma xenopodis]
MLPISDVPSSHSAHMSLSSRLQSSKVIPRSRSASVRVVSARLPVQQNRKSAVKHDPNQSQISMQTNEETTLRSKYCCVVVWSRCCRVSVSFGFKGCPRSCGASSWRGQLKS